MFATFVHLNLRYHTRTNIRCSATSVWLPNCGLPFSIGLATFGAKANEVSYPSLKDLSLSLAQPLRHKTHAIAETFGLLTKARRSRPRQRLYMRQAHTTMNLLPSGGFPARTAKIQFLTCITTVSTLDGASCLAQEQLYYKRRYLAIGSGKVL